MFNSAITIEVPCKDGICVSADADRVAWAADAWRIWSGHMDQLAQDGRRLSSVDAVAIARKPLAPNVAMVTLDLTYNGAVVISMPDAKAQFWALVLGAWTTMGRAS